MNILKYISLEKVRLLKKKQNLLTVLDSFPSGQLCLKKNGTYCQWYILTDNKRTYLPKAEKQLAQKLAYKELLLNQLEHINAQLNALSTFEQHYPVEEKSRTTEAISELALFDSPDLTVFRKSHAAESWAAENYEKNAEYPESLTIPTKSGIYVRSKSERIIADELFDNDIPFRYEQALILGDVKMFPDFTILHTDSTRDITIWEHFGLMNSSAYVNNVKLKLGTYFDAGFIPGHNLIITFESKQCPLNSNLVSLLVGYHFT